MGGALAVVSVVCATIALAGCTTSDPGPTGSAPASSSASAPAPSSASPSPASSAPGPSPSLSTSGGTAEQRFVSTVQRATPDLAALPADTVLALGRQVCTGFRSGDEAGRIAVALGESTAAPGLDETDVAFLLGGAVARLCPQYRDRLDGDG